MICPNCKCVVANNLVECDYCGYGLHTGMTKTLMIVSGSEAYGKPRTDYVRYSSTNPITAFSNTSSYHGMLSKDVYRKSGSGCSGYLTRKCNNSGEPKIYSSYSRPEVSYVTGSYKNAHGRNSGLSVGATANISMTNKLLMLVAVCLALLICLMLLLIV